MTDEKIIKALEFCAAHKCSSSCECPGEEEGGYGCFPFSISTILDLINRQRAEIGTLERLYELAVAEREANVKGFTESLETAKAETVKDITGYLESEIEDSDKRIREFDTSDEERGYNKGLRVALAYVQEFVEGV